MAGNGICVFATETHNYTPGSLVSCPRTFRGARQLAPGGGGEGVYGWVLGGGGRVKRRQQCFGMRAQTVRARTTESSVIILASP